MYFIYDNPSSDVYSENSLRMFESKVPRRIFGPKKEEVTIDGANYMIRILIICSVQEVLLG
jgi:hypothetical protein